MPPTIALHTELFRVRLSYERGKAYATMSKFIMGNGGLRLLMNLLVFQRGVRTPHPRVFTLSPSLLLDHLQTQSGKAKLLLPIMPIIIVAYAFTLLWDNLCRNSCI